MLNWPNKGKQEPSRLHGERILHVFGHKGFRTWLKSPELLKIEWCAWQVI